MPDLLSSILQHLNLVCYRRRRRRHREHGPFTARGRLAVAVNFVTLPGGRPVARHATCAEVFDIVLHLLVLALTLLRINNVPKSVKNLE